MALFGCAVDIYPPLQRTVDSVMSLRTAERAPPIVKHFSWGIALSRDMATLSATKANDTLGASVCRMLTNNAACVTLKERLTLSLYSEGRGTHNKAGADFATVNLLAYFTWFHLM